MLLILQYLNCYHSNNSHLNSYLNYNSYSNEYKKLYSIKTNIYISRLIKYEVEYCVKDISFFIYREQTWFDYILGYATEEKQIETKRYCHRNLKYINLSYFSINDTIYNFPHKFSHINRNPHYNIWKYDGPINISNSNNKSICRIHRFYRYYKIL